MARLLPAPQQSCGSARRQAAVLGVRRRPRRSLDRSWLDAPTPFPMTAVRLQLIAGSNNTTDDTASFDNVSTY